MIFMPSFVRTEA